MKKVIHLNTEHLNVNNAMKTRKKRVTISEDTISPILRQKALLRRIKDSKTQQLENMTSAAAATAKRIQLAPAFSTAAAAAGQSHHGGDDDDDFTDSMNVLQTFAAVREAPPDIEKTAYERKKMASHYNPYRLKNHGTLEHRDLDIDLNTPDSLMAASKMAHFEALDSVIPTYAVDKAVPYGVLRGGIKPTYRTWVKSALPGRSSDVTMGGAVTTTPNARMLAQRKIQLLREKYKSALDGGGGGGPIPPPNSLSFDVNPPITYETITAVGGAPTGPLNPNPPSQPPTATPTNLTPIKKVIKRTFKRKYSLGRSKTAQTIGVLIKNTTTRSRIIDAHKELKTHSIADVKRYLREHNLIKIGSDAPNDVLRALYENAILTGDVVNTNGGTLLHNFTNAKAGEHVVDGLEPIIIEPLFLEDGADLGTL